MNKKNCFKKSFWFTLVLFVFTCSTMNAQGLDNKISINVKSVEVKTVLDQIEKKSNLSFMYSSQLAKEWPKVSLNASNKSIGSILDDLMGLISCTYQLKGKIVTITKQQLSGKERTVSGYVRDENGEVLVGVPICIGESRVCTVTDADGFYTFNIPAEKTVLKFSYVGMRDTYITVAAGNNNLKQNVTLNGDNVLNEVVVTGYQDIQSSKMTGSTVTINAGKLETRYATNVMNNLEGRVAGLSTYGGEMKIRGTSSLYAETSPLLVVDGIPTEGKIEDINPYDIESINVLKDAAAAAIYGARASNGIIVITTKNAKKKGDVEIDFSTNLTIMEKKNLDYHDNFYMNPEENVNTEATYWDYYYNSGKINNPEGSTETTLKSNQISPIRYAYYQKKLGQISDAQLQQTLEKLKKNNYAKEFGDAIFRQQMMQQYNLSLRGRSERLQNNLTINYKHDNLGIIEHGSSSFNINYKGFFDVTKWLTATFTVNSIFDKKYGYGNDRSIDPSNPWRFAAYESMYNEDGSIRRRYSTSGGSDYSPELSEGLEKLSYTYQEELKNNTSTTRRQHTLYHGDLLFRIMDGLTANAQFIYERDHVNTLWYANEKSNAARSMKYGYAQYDASTGAVSYLTPSSGGIRSDINNDGQYWTARGQLNYSKTFGKHAINALAGMEFRETKTNGSKTLYLGYDDQLQNSATQTVDFGVLSSITKSPYFMASNGGYSVNELVFQPYINGNLTPIVEQKHRYASGYANATYTFDDRYNFFASFRKDYADVYGLNVKFRGKPLWSVGAGWLMNNETFMKDVQWVNYLKLRFSYGVTGNIYQGATSYMTATSTGLNMSSGLPYGEVSSPANPNLRWEQSRTTNIGVDYSLLDNRLRGAVDYYHKVGKDIFSKIALDPTTGFSSMVANAASMVNKGLELQMTYDWFQGKTRNDFSWTTNFTFAYNKNEVTKVENDATIAAYLIVTPFKEGYPTSALWSYRFADISDEEGELGKTRYYIEDDGKSVSPQDKSIDVLEYSGQSEPKVIMGMDNSFYWKGFTLSVLAAYYGGHKMRAIIYDESMGISGPIASYFLNSWTPENKTDMPGIGQYGTNTTRANQTLNANRSVRDASFLKIRNIVLGYDFDPQWIKSLGMNRLRLQFQIDNPKALWIANKVHVDPETLGIRNPSSFIFGLNVNF